MNKLTEFQYTHHQTQQNSAVESTTKRPGRAVTLRNLISILYLVRSLMNRVMYEYVRQWGRERLVLALDFRLISTLVFRQDGVELLALV